MKEFLVFSFLALGLTAVRAGFPVYAQQPGEKKPSAPKRTVAVVDVDRLFKGHPKHEVMLKEINDTRIRLAAEDGALLTAVNELGFAVDVALKKGDRDTARALQEKRNQAEKGWLTFRAKVKQDLDKLTNDRTQDIMLDVKKTVHEYAVKQAIEVVLSYKAEPPVYAAPGVDITEEVLAILTKK
jgi:Skp family chaperone for outer membrane proteins